MESSFNKHNFHGIHNPMKPRGGPREGAGSGGKREGSGSGGKREGSGGKRKNSGPNEELTAEVIFTI